MNRAQRRRAAHLKRKTMKPALAEHHAKLRALPPGARLLYVVEGAPGGGDGSMTRAFGSIGAAARVAKAGDVIEVHGVYTQNETVTLPLGVRVRGTVSAEALPAQDAQAATSEALQVIKKLARREGPQAANEPPPEPEPVPVQAPPESVSPAATPSPPPSVPPATGPSNPFAGLGAAIASAIGRKART